MGHSGRGASSVFSDRSAYTGHVLDFGTTVIAAIAVLLLHSTNGHLFQPVIEVLIELDESHIHLLSMNRDIMNTSKEPENLYAGPWSILAGFCCCAPLTFAYILRE
jgi:hypothetical protein